MNDYSNSIGVHTLVWAGKWEEKQARFAIEQSAAAGYDVIELLMMDPRSIDVAMTRSLLDEYGMEASASLGLSAATDVSSDDQDTVNAGRRLLADAASVSVELGVLYVGGVVFGALQKYSQPVSERGRANSVESVRTFADTLGASNIPVGLEVVNRYESNLLNTGRQAVEYIKEVGSKNLYVHLDSYHMNIEEFDMSQAVHDCGELLGYVHIGENHRGYLGTGTVDFTGLFRGLKQIDYQGIVTFESFSSAVVDPGLSYTLAIWRNLWSDNLDLARHARGFIDAQLRSAARTAQTSFSSEEH
jgi:D-psicose/D-tagatose/L-ribulose 3-epimerase